MKKLIIHIGTHKTGTSAFQKVCRKHSKFFKDKFNLSFLDITKEESLKVKDINVAQRIMLSENVDFEASKKLNDYLNEQLKDEKEAYLLSYEGFSGNLKKLYSNRKWALKNLANAIPNSVDVTIMIAFRKQDQFIQSAYNQQRHGGDFMKFNDFYDFKFKEGLDWCSFLQDIEANFPLSKLIPIPYDTSVLQKKSLPKIIFTELGIKENQLLELESNLSIEENRGFNTDAALLYETLIPKLNNIKEKKLLRRYLQRYSSKKVFEEYNIISEREKKAISNLYKDSNLKLFKKYCQKKYSLNDFSPSVQDEFSQKNNVNLEKFLILKLIEEVARETKKRNNSFFIRVAYKMNSVFKI